MRAAVLHAPNTPMTIENLEISKPKRREVLMASGPATAPLAERAGVQFARSGNDSDVWFARSGERTRRNPGDGIAPERINPGTPACTGT